MDWVIMDILSDAFTKSIAANQHLYHTWVSYIAYTLEIVVLLALGGTIFGEWITAKSQDVLTGYQEQLERVRTERVDDLREGLQEHILSISKAVKEAKVRNLLKTLFTADWTKCRAVV